MKDHEIAELVNTLCKIAKTHHNAQCLREVISRTVVSAIKGDKPPTVKPVTQK